MKSNLFKGIMMAFMAVALTSCSKDDDVMPNTDQTIVEIVSENNNFSMLRTAVVRAGLTATLDGSGPFTVFAPTNDAFKAAGFTTEASINEVPVETLKSILLYHVLASKVNASAIPTASNTAVETAGGDNIFVTKGEAGVFVNGAKVTQADVMASNGVIHVVDKVLMPPMGNIVETLVGNSEFSFLVAAVLRASEGSTDVRAVLESDGPFTVFAPTNQAFMNAGFASEQAIRAASPAALTSILTYHVVQARVFSSGLRNGLSVDALMGGPLTFDLSADATVKGTSNTSASRITGVDMVTENGVIHVIDQVLLP